MQRYGNYRTESKIFNPTLDLYFWRQLGRKQELIMAITGNYFDSGLDTRSSEYDSADDRPVFEDFLTVGRPEIFGHRTGALHQEFREGRVFGRRTLCVRVQHRAYGQLAVGRPAGADDTDEQLPCGRSVG